MQEIGELIDYMTGSKIFSKLDMFAGYCRTKLAEIILEKDAFRCELGCFQYEAMRYGLTNARFTIERMTESLSKDLDFVRVCIENVFIVSRTTEKHNIHLIVICDHSKASTLKCNWKKYLCSTTSRSMGMHCIGGWRWTAHGGIELYCWSLTATGKERTAVIRNVLLFEKKIFA